MGTLEEDMLANLCPECMEEGVLVRDDVCLICAKTIEILEREYNDTNPVCVGSSGSLGRMTPRRVQNPRALKFCNTLSLSAESQERVDVCNTAEVQLCQKNRTQKVC